MSQDQIAITLTREEWEQIRQDLLPHTRSSARCAQKPWCPQWELVQKIESAMEITEVEKE